MIFKGKDNQFAIIRILDYLVPDTREAESLWDSNWLIICLHIRNKSVEWESIDSSVLTFGIKELIDWINILSEGRLPDCNTLGFFKSTLFFKYFKVENQDIKLRIYFGTELRPKFASKDDECYVEFDLTHKKLQQIAKDLKDELTCFPIRVINPDDQHFIEVLTGIKKT